MSSTRLSWDGSRRLGPVALGMPIGEVQAQVPGAGSFVEAYKYDPDPLFYWESEEMGLSIAFAGSKVLAITSYEEFIVDGQNLVGLPEQAAVLLCGGESSRDAGKPIDIVSTVSGIELFVLDGNVSMVRMSAFDSLSD